MSSRHSFNEFHLTLSPKGDLEEIPPEIAVWLVSGGWEKVLAVAELADKWHIHIALRHKRAMRLDNVRTLFKQKIPDYNVKGTPWEHGRVALNLEACVTCDINGIAGGYLTKTEDVKVLMQFGFTEEDLSEGAKEYERGKKSQAVASARKTLKACTKEVYESLLYITLGGELRKWELNGKKGPKPCEIEAHETMIDSGYCFLPHIKEEYCRERARTYVKDVYGKRILTNAGHEKKPAPTSATLLPEVMPVLKPADELPPFSLEMPEGYIPDLEM